MQKKSWNGRRNVRYSMADRCADMLSVQGIRLKTREELKEAEGKAWSIGANNQPVDPQYIGSRQEGDDTHHYFKDVDGKFYYLSSRIMEFEKELEASQRKKTAMRKHGRGYNTAG